MFAAGMTRSPMIFPLERPELTWKWTIKWAQIGPCFETLPLLMPCDLSGVLPPTLVGVDDPLSGETTSIPNPRTPANWNMSDPSLKLNAKKRSFPLLVPYKSLAKTLNFSGYIVHLVPKLHYRSQFVAGFATQFVQPVTSRRALTTTGRFRKCS